MVIVGIILFVCFLFFVLNKNIDFSWTDIGLTDFIWIITGGAILAMVGTVIGFFEEGFLDEKLLKLATPYEGIRKGYFFSFFQHFKLRALMSLPYHLVSFLNEMSRRHLLEFDGDLETETGGGTWRWRHRIIQEWFLTPKP